VSLTEQRIVKDAERPETDGAYWFELTLSDGTTLMVSIPKGDR
jgi:hypothetical protein